MGKVPKTAGLVSHDGMGTPLSPGDKICRPVWVSGLLKLLKPAYNKFFVMVCVLASTSNEPYHPVGDTHAWLLVCPSPQSSLATGPSLVSPRDHDVMNWIQVPPGPALQLLGTTDF